MSASLSPPLPDALCRIAKALPYAASDPAKFLHLLEPPLLSEQFEAQFMSGTDVDRMLALGWRFHHAIFFRYNLWFRGGEVHWILPLRVRADRWELSKSQRRNLRRNADLQIKIEPARIDTTRENLLQRHAERFTENAPESLFDFLSVTPSTVPCPIFEIGIYHRDRLVAASYMAIGSLSVSSIYAMFDPELEDRGLGVFTLLQELLHTREQRLLYHYPGYATMHRSLYDYKKAYLGLEYYDWMGEWHPFPRGGWPQLGPPPSFPGEEPSDATSLDSDQKSI